MHLGDVSHVLGYGTAAVLHRRRVPGARGAENVGALESVCTGQIYVPTLAAIIKMSPFYLFAWTLLLLYNLMFIIPLLIIFFLGYFGIHFVVLRRFEARHIGKMKIMTSFLFFGIGYFWILYDKNSLSWSDIVTKTKIVKIDE